MSDPIKILNEQTRYLIKAGGFRVVPQKEAERLDHLHPGFDPNEHAMVEHTETNLIVVLTKQDFVTDVINKLIDAADRRTRLELRDD